VDGRSWDASLAQVRLQALSVECSFCDSSWGGERAVSPRAFVHHPFLVSNLNLGMLSTQYHSIVRSRPRTSQAPFTAYLELSSGNWIGLCSSG
jgi:hypothetical protein